MIGEPMVVARASSVDPPCRLAIAMTRSRVLSVIGLALLFGCAHAPSTEVALHRLGPPSAVAPPEPDVPLTASATVGVAPPASPPVAVATAPADAADAASPPLDGKAWLASRGVTTVDDALEAALWGCSVIHMKGGPAELLQCDGGGPMEGSLPQGESLFPVWVIYPFHGKAVIALKAPIAAGALDKEEAPRADDPDRGQYLQLLAGVSADGARFVIRERPGGGCAEKLRELRKSNTTDPEIKGVLTPHIQVVERACRARGSYGWKGGRLVR